MVYAISRDDVMEIYKEGLRRIELEASFAKMSGKDLADYRYFMINGAQSALSILSDDWESVHKMCEQCEDELGIWEEM